MNRLLPIFVALALSAPTISLAQIHPPKDGVEIPAAARERMAKDKNAFRFEKAWIDKARQVRESRNAYIARKGKYDINQLSAPELSQYAITGNFYMPVFAVKFSNTGSDPYPVSTLQTKLFNGPFSPRSLNDYYDEISYNTLNMTGTVFGWTTLPNTDVFYEGGSGCNGLCGSANIASLITTTLNANDGAVNFGLYDNDGPDGLPNSGDDDGFVDVVAFIHPEAGGECGNSNIWSHRWNLGGWGLSPFTTNDSRTGGGFIKIWDYVIQPAYNCGGATVIDIGVFCHEFGHALGLPDLYDTANSSQGIGEWGLMGSGNWNTSTSPAHMSAWCKDQLGWINLVDVGTKSTVYSVDNIENNNTAYRLTIPDERWRRSNTCNIAGAFSMHCGLAPAEATARNWAAGEGYGDGWDETVTREFSYDGATHPVMFGYSYDYESEPGYDFTYLRINVGATSTTIRAYSGVAAGSENINLTTYLNGSGVSTYSLSFVFQSDVGWSDKDNGYPTTCGAFTFDNVSLTGGGENYSSNFETYEDGWYNDNASPTEYFLMENRQKIGSDVPLHRQGLVVYHVAEDAGRSTGNTGGVAGNNPRGVMLEEADGLNNLLSGANRGDAGDPFPGSSNNTLFNNLSTPNSRGYSGSTNRVALVTGGSGDPNSVTMSANWPAPTYAAIAPSSGEGQVVLTIDGTNFVHGATVSLSAGGPTYDATTVEWVGHERVIATVDVGSAALGFYDLTVTNPGGGDFTQANAFEVTGTAVAFQLSEVYARENGIVLRWQATSDHSLLGFNIYRAPKVGTFVRLNEDLIAPGKDSFLDTTAEPGRQYRYRIGGVDNDGEFFSLTHEASMPGLTTALEQNVPNPFNPTTVIQFTLAEDGEASLQIFDASGQLVRTLVNGQSRAGRHQVTWNGTSNAGETVTSGVYFYRLSAGHFTETRKMVLLK